MFSDYSQAWRCSLVWADLVNSLHSLTEASLSSAGNKNFLWMNEIHWSVCISTLAEIALIFVSQTLWLFHSNHQGTPCLFMSFSLRLCILYTGGQCSSRRGSLVPTCNCWPKQRKLMTVCRRGITFNSKTQSRIKESSQHILPFSDLFSSIVYP